jgi:hypothetical protein
MKVFKSMIKEDLKHVAHLEKIVSGNFESAEDFAGRSVAEWASAMHQDWTDLRLLEKCIVRVLTGQLNVLVVNLWLSHASGFAFVFLSLFPTVTYKVRFVPRTTHSGSRWSGKYGERISTVPWSSVTRIPLSFLAQRSTISTSFQPAKCR